MGMRSDISFYQRKRVDEKVSGGGEGGREGEKE